MLENLQVGDKLIRKEVKPGFTPAEFHKGTVLALCGGLVAVKIEDEENDNNWAWWTYKVLDDYGWQLEKKKWVPSLGEKYYFVIMSGGEIKNGTWNNDNTDRFNLEINNVSRTQKEAEAYRNKLVEVMGREGV